MKMIMNLLSSSGKYKDGWKYKSCMLLFGEKEGG